MSFDAGKTEKLIKLGMYHKQGIINITKDSIGNAFQGRVN